MKSIASYNLEIYYKELKFVGKEFVEKTFPYKWAFYQNVLNIPRRAK